ncbi:MAG: FixH family protein [Spirochaetaceae bacterium]|jgi:hypothetical protein|nr:FixH family protein [Spirochaetaceae bacterium]
MRNVCVFSKGRPQIAGLLVAFIFALGIASNAGAQTVKLEQKTVINDSYSFKAEFSKKPKMGESILKVTLWDKDGKQVTDLELIGSYDMNSMAGQHSMAPKTVLTSKQGYYLFPVNFTMKGKWEITLVFKQADKELYTATIQVSI